METLPSIYFFVLNKSSRRRQSRQAVVQCAGDVEMYLFRFWEMVSCKIPIRQIGKSSDVIYFYLFDLLY